MTLPTLRTPSPRPALYRVSTGVLHDELLRGTNIASTSTSPDFVSRGHVFVYDRTTSQNIDRLLAGIDDLSRRIEALEGRLEEVPAIELRELPDGDAKSEIKNYFESHHRTVLYPSDVAEALRLDYEQVTTLLEQLEKEGAIGKKEESI